jgi:hypothetical protein
MDAISFNNVDDLYTTQMRGLAPAGSLTRVANKALGDPPPPPPEKKTNILLFLFLWKQMLPLQLFL